VGWVAYSYAPTDESVYAYYPMLWSVGGGSFLCKTLPLMVLPRGSILLGASSLMCSTLSDHRVATELSLLLIVEASRTVCARFFARGQVAPLILLSMHCDFATGAFPRLRLKQVLVFRFLNFPL
jgi:hypothetical protein